MSDPVRLVHEGADDFELELLRSAQGDVGSDRLMRRTLGAVAVAGTLTAASAAGQAAVAAKAGGLSLLKWIGIGALAGVGAITTYAVSRPADPGEPARVVVATAAARAGAMAKAEVTARVLDQAPAPDALAVTDAAKEASPDPAVAGSPASIGGDRHGPAGRAGAREQVAPSRPAEPSSAPASPPASPASTAAPEGPASLRAEVASLDRARGALGRGDGAGALRELDRHATEFPRGALGPEATVLRIDALVRTGQRPAAEALATRFLASPSHAAHATRVQSILRPRAPSQPTSNP